MRKNNECNMGQLKTMTGRTKRLCQGIVIWAKQKYPAVLDFLRTVGGDAANWCRLQSETYNQWRSRRRYTARIRRVILSSPELYFLRRLYCVVAEEREVERVSRHVEYKCGVGKSGEEVIIKAHGDGVASSISSSTYHQMFGVRGKIRENWLQLLRRLLEIDDEKEEAWEIAKRIEECEQKRKSCTCRPGGYFYTKAGRKRKDLPWTLEPGSVAMKKAKKRWPGRSLWRISREVEPLLGELYAIMEERGLIEPLNMLGLGLARAIYRGRQKPPRAIWLWYREELRDMVPGYRSLKLSAEDRQRLFCQ